MTEKASIELVESAAARNMSIVLSLPSAGMLRNHKSRFLDFGDDGFWVEAAARDRALVDDLIARRETVGISFRTGTRKNHFLTTLLRRDESHRINDKTVVDALLVARPTHVESVQRRSSYRVRVTEDCGLKARIWRITAHAVVTDVPPASAEMPINLIDLSVGGMGIVLKEPPVTRGKSDPATLPLADDQRLRVELSWNDESFVLEARLRYSLDRAGKPRAGVQFKKLENDLNGRQTLARLARIVGDIQRDEVRRVRLGLSA
jgi:c-di-GMP-binding flagellar brake protein YcgR